MQCPDIKNAVQSLKKGQQRTKQAMDALGTDVMIKIFVFSLYCLGYSYEYISKLSGFSQPGVKRIVNEVLKNGVFGFLDKRKKITAKQPMISKINKTAVIETSIECKQYNHNYVQYLLSGRFCLKIRKDDTLSNKVLTLLLFESGLIEQQEAARILECHRNTVYLNLEKFKIHGAKGLLDARVGQKANYKFDSQVMAEIVNAFIVDIMEGHTPTKTTISGHLKNKFSQEYSQSAVASHLKKIGLTEHKEDLVKNICKQVNAKIESLEYLDPDREHIISRVDVGPMKYIKENLRGFNVSEKEYNLFELESRVEKIQSDLQPVILQSLIEEMQKEIICPACHGRQVELNINPKKHRVVKTSLGGEWILSGKMFTHAKCQACRVEFDMLDDFLKLPAHASFTPLTKKKICSANLAKSYESAAINLKQQIGLEISKKQVRNISTQVGEYINVEFKEIYKEIRDGLNRPEIARRHPLVNELEIDNMYLDKSRYLIVVAVDGGRMQLFDWIPPNGEFKKAKKRLYWHENKVFRISIYDKNTLIEVTGDIDGMNKKQKYKSAKIIPELTTYGATNESWKDTGPLILSHLYMRGIDPKDVQLCLSDGSEHIMEGIFTPVFPKALHIMDYYHKSEALHSCLKSLDLNDKKINNQLTKYLWEGRIETLVKNLKEIQLQVGLPVKGKRNPAKPEVKLDNLINHLNSNKDRLRYKEYRDLKYPIGSGSIESAVKLFGKRIKGTEKQWNEEGGESILHLYAFLLSKDERWDKLWAFQTPWISK
jgi:transposase